MSAVTFTVGFSELDLGEANQAAARLRADLLEYCGPDDRIDVVRESETTQDAGSILALTLSAPVLVEIAHGLAAFIAARGNAIVIKNANGLVVAHGSAATNFDAAAVVKALKTSISTD